MYVSLCVLIIQQIKQTYDTHVNGVFMTINSPQPCIQLIIKYTLQKLAVFISLEWETINTYEQQLQNIWKP